MTLRFDLSSFVRRLFLALVVGFLCVPQMASAQTKPAPAPAPAPAPPATPAAMAAARELIVVSGLSRSFAILIPQFMDQIATSVTQTRPDLIRDLNTVLENLKPEFDKQADEMIDLSAQIYVRLMSESELKAAVNFFKSDAGRKYVDSQPAFMTDALGAMQGWQARISTNMVTRIRAEMKKKGHDM